MSRHTFRFALTATVPLALFLQGCAATANTVPDATVVTPSGPALWKVADEDTTIYLFGTVHALPKDTGWYQGPIATALASTDELVTEIPKDSVTDPASQQSIMAKAMMPAGENLRTSLTDTQRATYEAALNTLGLPPGAFDQFDPWFASMTMSILPLMKAGYAAESGVELTIDKLAPETAGRGALETLEWQIDMFDSMPADVQTEFLISTAQNIDRIAPMMDQMVAEWLEGDADGLAALMNAGLTDPRLATILLYDRNERWAGWIDERMDKPGTVFIAVGAGHLAGQKSVQDYLTHRGFSVARVQ